MEFCGANNAQTQNGRLLVQPLKIHYVKMNPANNSCLNSSGSLRISLNIRTLHFDHSHAFSRCAQNILLGPATCHPQHLRSPSFLAPLNHFSYLPQVNSLYLVRDPTTVKLQSGVSPSNQNTSTYRLPHLNTDFLDASLHSQSIDNSQDSNRSSNLAFTKPVNLPICDPSFKQPASNLPNGYFREERKPKLPVATSKTDPFESVNFSKLKQLIFQYFYSPDDLVISEPLTSFEMCVFRVFLIKKLVHDKKKSKIFFAIRNLREDELLQFLQANPAVNRKNIIKSNIFKRVWKALEKKHRGNFSEHFFGALISDWPKDSFSIKQYRKTHCFNLADEFYARCFVSDNFKDEFFQILDDNEFRETVLRQSRQKFANCFDFWMTETIVFLEKTRTPLERNTKLPDYKYGMSAKDYEMASSLFLKLLVKD
jgi:hypothetical protein